MSWVETSYPWKPFQPSSNHLSAKACWKAYDESDEDVGVDHDDEQDDDLDDEQEDDYDDGDQQRALHSWNQWHGHPLTPAQTPVSSSNS